MATKSNDTKILQLKKQIEEKKAALAKTERFTPITNCFLVFAGTEVNIQTLNKEQLLQILVQLNSLRLSAIDLDVLADYVISRYSVTDWMGDVKARLMNLNRQAELARLKVMEDKLHNLLSGDKKTELEIEEIANSL